MAQQKVVYGRWLVSGEHASPHILTDAAVVVEDGRIVAVGDRAQLLSQYPNAERLGSDSTAVLPGFINAHHHSHGVSTIQQGMPDDLLEPWILAFAGIRPTDIRLNTLLSCARQLRSGVTTVVDVHSGGGTAEEYAASVDRALGAYEEAGMRVAFATGVGTQSFLVHGAREDQAFLRTLPDDLRQRSEQLLPSAGRVTRDEYLAIVDERVKRYASHPRLQVWYGPPGPQWVSDALMQDIAEHAERFDTNIQTHCVESIYEMLHGHRCYGKRTVQHLRELGVLSSRFSLAHGVWLTDPEIETLVDTGAALSHNPSSNLRLRAGIAPLNALLTSGATVALGMDGTTLNEDEDMFTEMRLAMRLHRTPQLGAACPSSTAIFTLATEGGAKLMRKEGVLGRLAPGYQADLVLVDLEDITWPWVAPEADPLELLLMRARAGHVDTVMVGGQVVLRAKLPTRFDVAAAAAELSARLGETPYPQAQAALVRALTPHLEAWYASWEVPRLDPYIRYNSRG